MYKRVVNAFGLIIFIIGLLIIGLLKTTLSFSVDTASMKSSRKKILCTSRGYIYDRNLNPLVNEELFISDYNISDKNSIREISVRRYGKNQLCSHLIGYINADNYGVSAIEKSYNSILSYYSGELSASFSASARGRIIGRIENASENNYLSKGGVVLTIDKNIQYITEKCVDDAQIDKGAAVVMEVKTGRITALCSRPNVDLNDIETELTKNNSPLINRALTKYSVGSVFKPIIAAAALEKGINPKEEYNCNGSIKVGDTIFPCHKKDGHGKLNMYEATAQSCNTFFINLTRNIDADYLINTACNFGFGNRIEIADGLYADSGNLPNKLSSGHKANFSFGQGELTATPVHLAAAYAAIGNNGIYNTPIIIDSIVDENLIKYKKAMNIASRRIISKESADTVLSALKMTVEKGSGKNASPRNVTAAGKTATAQSGWFINGREITHSWFVGMFPAENPLYVVVIMKEDGESGSYDCAPIFKSIAEIITSYE